MPKWKARHYIPRVEGRGFSYNIMGEVQSKRLSRRIDWVKESDQQPKPKLSIQRKERVSPLTKICAQW